jgi:aarF domain-containing kinase
MKVPSSQCRNLRTDQYQLGFKSKSHSQKPPKGHNILWAAATLSPAVFLRLSEEDNNGIEHTAEERMLRASRDEIEQKLSEEDHCFSRFRRCIVLFLDLYIWEPMCTGLRFFHLVLIFVPVIIVVPALWLGPRDQKRDNERSGALWWYWFLVRSMERAGPAFIKVVYLRVYI